LILADTNVLLDVVTQDPLWSDWSRRQLNVAAATDEIAINDAVYAELSVGDQRMDELDYMIVTAGIAMAPMPRPALFHAGTAFQRYRQSGVVGPASCRISLSAPMP
jgi:predicted nucleic acid-binding protein